MSDQSAKSGRKSDVGDGSQPLKVHRHEAFARQIVNGVSQFDAYRACYPRSRKWKDASVHTEAARLVPKIAPRIDWLKKQAASAAVLTREEALKILTEQARASMADFATCGKDGVTLDVGPEKLRSRAVKNMHSRTIYDQKTGDTAAIVTEVELYDARGAIETLAKLEGWNAAEKKSVEVEGLEELMDSLADTSFGPPHLRGKTPSKEA